MRTLALHPGYLRRPPPIAATAYAELFIRHPGFPKVSSSATTHPTSRGMRFVAEHPYGDRWWLIRHRHPITAAKDLGWESLNDHGERVPGLLGTPLSELPLYREHDLTLAIGAREPVLLVESESSVDALNRGGFYATTWAGDASSPQIHRLQSVLDGYDQVVAIPDNDEPGWRCMCYLDTEGLVPHAFCGDEGEDARDLWERIGPIEFARMVEAALASG